MGRTSEEQVELAKEVAAANAEVPVGASYWHHKSREKIYKVIGHGFLEATDELCVIYQAEYGERLTFIRPLTVWLEQVEWEGETVPRFHRIEE